jgi:hypothetical protein
VWSAPLLQPLMSGKLQHPFCFTLSMLAYTRHSCFYCGLPGDTAYRCYCLNAMIRCLLTHVYQMRTNCEPPIRLA